jgi:hypothetical protein
LVGTASTAGYATTAFNLNGVSSGDLNVAYATTAGVATSLANGSVGNVPYQSAPDTTAFVTNGSTGQVLISNGNAAPSWGDVSAATGSFGGITVKDEGTQVGTGNSITTLNFVGSNIRATATTGANGIATITISDNLVGTALSISGITTIGFGNTGVVINSGIITSTNPGYSTVTYYGNLVGTASTAGYATTAFNLNGIIESNLNVAYASTAGIATNATKLQTARTISLSNDLGGSATFDGSSDISISATIQPNSVALGSDTTGDYVQSITGTSNQIAVSVTSGESSTPVISIPNNPTLPGTTVTIQNDLQVNRNLNVNGNITLGGTTAFLNVQQLLVSDPDLILGVRTDAFGNDVSNDTTANHGGIAIASTEGSPLVNFNVAGIETLAPTYKKIMWFKSGTFAGLGTDAWLFNYAVGIGSTQFPSGTRLAVGSVQFTENDLVSVRNINATGVITATKFVGSVGFATTSTNLAGGAQGSLPYQYSSGITSFLSSGSNNQVLLYDLGNNKPYWGDVSSGSGSFSGITVRDEGTTPYSNITTVDIFGNNITATSGGIGIASIRVSDNLVGTSLSISGISTLGGVQISSGIISSTTGTAVTYYGDGSNLTGISGGVAISTNTTNQVQYLTYVTGTGTTTGFGITTTGLVFNPSSGNLGIGSATPTSKLTVQGNVLISGITTSGIIRISSSTASPNASVPVATLEAVGASSNYDIAIVPKGNGAIVANIPDGTSVGGNKRGTYAVDLQLSRNGATQVASGENSFIGNGYRNTASGWYSAVLNGSANASSSTYSIICGGATNAASGEKSFIGNGAGNIVAGNYTSVINGEQNNAQTSAYCIIGGGKGNSTNGDYSSILCASYSTTRKKYSSVISGHWGDTRNTYGAVVFSGANDSFGSGFSAGGGYQQSRLAILSKATTDATPSTLTADGNAYDTNNVLQVVTKSAYLVKGSVIAYSDASDLARAWEFTAAVKNTSGVSLVGTPIINDIAYDSGASGWNLSITADSGTSSLKVEVTGQASTTIRWVTKMDSTEVAFQ